MTDTVITLLTDCQSVLEYEFQDLDLLKQCLTHASAASTRLQSNERLEFLGDAILGTVVCELLYHRFPEFTEGELTRLKSNLVSRNTCSKIADYFELDRFLIVGKGLGTGDLLPLSVKAAVVESLIAGVYLDGGLEEATGLIERFLDAELERVSKPNHSCNYKSQLQQLCQKEFAETPCYRLLDEKGPDHSKCFKITAMIGSRAFPAAWGPNKKLAEQRAALNALSEIREQEVPYLSE